MVSFQAGCTTACGLWGHADLTGDRLRVCAAERCLNVNVWLCSYGGTEVPSAVGSILAPCTSSHRCADTRPAPDPCPRSGPNNCSTQWTWGEQTTSWHIAGRSGVIDVKALMDCGLVKCSVPAVGRAHTAEAMGAAAGGTSGPGRAGGVQVLSLWDVTPSRRRSLREQRTSVTPGPFLVVFCYTGTDAISAALFLFLSGDRI